MDKIYCFINQINRMGHLVTAYAEDGEYLAGHCSSNKGYAMHDIGINSNWKRDKYEKKYPEGYVLIWLESEDEQFQRVIDMIKNKQKERKEVKL